MLLTKEIEDGFIGFDHSLRREEKNYTIEMFDDVFVHWEKKMFFGKTKRVTKTFTFKRFKSYNKNSYTYTMDSSCESFLRRLSNKSEEKNNKSEEKNKHISNSIIIKNLKAEFDGADDFSLGVQHALSILEKEGLISLEE